MHCTDAGESLAFSLIARRNSSLSSSGRQLVFAALFAVSFGIALAFATQGAWLILPFSAVEMLVLFLAFRWIERHAGDYERLTLQDDRLVLEAHVGDRAERVEFNRHWAQLIVQADGPHCRIALRSHGREVEFGAHLTDGQRFALAGQLRQRLGRPI